MGKILESIKKNGARWDWMSFLANFMAVVIGIVLTFAIQKIIDKKAERNDVDKSLQLVSNELITNLEMLLACDSAYMRELAAAEFLIRYEDDFFKAPADSFNMYANEPFMIRDIDVVSDAFELQKMSSLLQKIEDQELALNIIKTYASLNEAANYFNTFYEMKIQSWQKANGDNVRNVFLKNDYSAPEVWTAVMSSSDGKVFVKEIRTKMIMWTKMEPYIQQVRTTVKQIEDYINK